MKKFLSLAIILSCIQFAQAQTITWYQFPPNLFEPSNRYIYFDNKDVKWVGAYDSGIHKFSNGQWSRYTPGNSGLTDDDVRQSCFDTAGNLWMATWEPTQ